LALYGGEDFELLFTCPFDKVSRLKSQLKTKCRLPITVVGQVMEAKFGVKLKHKNGKFQPLKARGYEHFKGEIGEALFNRKN
jgi:thiamine-monophosphate kinase